MEPDEGSEAMKTVFCYECQYYSNAVKGEGYCRRYPPTVSFYEEELRWVSRFPIVSQEMWCGEGVPRVPEDEADR